MTRMMLNTIKLYNWPKQSDIQQNCTKHNDAQHNKTCQNDTQEYETEPTGTVKSDP